MSPPFVYIFVVVSELTTSVGLKTKSEGSLSNFLNIQTHSTDEILFWLPPQLGFNEQICVHAWQQRT